MSLFEIDTPPPRAARAPVPLSEIDHALTAQFVIAWAGESGEEKRLGGGLISSPRTAAWISSSVCCPRRGNGRCSRARAKRHAARTQNCAARTTTRIGSSRSLVSDSSWTNASKSACRISNARGTHRRKHSQRSVRALSRAGVAIDSSTGSEATAKQRPSRRPSSIDQGEPTRGPRSTRATTRRCAGAARRPLSTAAFPDSVTDRPHEATEVHTRLLRCALEIEDSRAYWAHAPEAMVASARQAFDEYWFGARSLSRIKVLLANMRVRFDAFPVALETLHRWPHMSPDTRRAICHWHLQLHRPRSRPRPRRSHRRSPSSKTGFSSVYGRRRSRPTTASTHSSARGPSPSSGGSTSTCGTGNCPARPTSKRSSAKSGPA